MTAMSNDDERHDSEIDSAIEIVEPAIRRLAKIVNKEDRLTKEDEEELLWLCGKVMEDEGPT